MNNNIRVSNSLDKVLIRQARQNIHPDPDANCFTYEFQETTLGDIELIYSIAMVESVPKPNNSFPQKADTELLQSQKQ